MSFWLLLIFKQICVSGLILIQTKIFPLWDVPTCQIQAVFKAVLAHLEF